MIARLICALLGHDNLAPGETYRTEWRFKARVVWMTRCLFCQGVVDEGNSDGWILTDWVADHLMRNVRSMVDWWAESVLTEEEARYRLDV